VPNLLSLELWYDSRGTEQRVRFALLSTQEVQLLPLGCSCSLHLWLNHRIYIQADLFLEQTTYLQVQVSYEDSIKESNYAAE